MADSPTYSEPWSGEERFRADLLAYLDGLPIGELAELLIELPVMTRVTLTHELSDRGLAWQADRITRSDRTSRSRQSEERGMIADAH